MRVIERYATAAIADDLKDRGPLSDLHILTAAGMAWVAGTWPSSLYRLKYANDATEYTTCLRGLKRIAANEAKKRGWRLAHPGQLARKALDYWIADICPECTGRGAKTILGTPVLEDEPCSGCAGTGRRKHPFEGTMAECAAVLIWHMDENACRAAGQIMQKLADDMELT